MLPPREPANWDNVFMGIAEVISHRSKDPNTQIGAVIIDSLNRIVSVGFNGPPRLIEDTSFSWERPEKYHFVKHAEDNAIWFGSLARGWDGLRNTVIYVTGPPCPSCILSAVRAEISVIVYDSSKQISMLSSEQAGNWELSQRIAKLGSVELRDYRTPHPQSAPKAVRIEGEGDERTLTRLIEEAVKQQDEKIEHETRGVKTSSNWGD